MVGRGALRRVVLHRQTRVIVIEVSDKERCLIERDA